MAWLRFGSYRFDTEQQNLFKGDAQVPLRHRTAELLACFLAHPDELMTRAQLLSAVWKNVHVSDAVVPQTLSDLRRVLRNGSEHGPFVVNIKGKGYRWVCPVTAIEEAASTGPDAEEAVDLPPEPRHPPETGTGETAVKPSPPRRWQVAVWAAVVLTSCLFLWFVFYPRTEGPVPREHRDDHLVLMFHPYHATSEGAAWRDRPLLDLTATLLEREGRTVGVYYETPIDLKETPRESDAFREVATAVAAGLLVLVSAEQDGGETVVSVGVHDRYGPISSDTFRANGVTEAANTLSLRLGYLMDLRQTTFMGASSGAIGEEAADYLARGVLLMNQRKLQESLAWLERARELVPDSHRIQLTIAKALTQSMSLSEAARICEELLADDDAGREIHARALRVQGLIAGKQGRREEQVRIYRRILEAYKPAYDTEWRAEILNELGSSLTQLGETEEARPLLEEAADHYRRTGEHMGLGLAYSNLGANALTERNDAEALERLKMAEQIFLLWGHPTHILTNWLNQSVALKRLERYEEAEQMAEAVLDASRQAEFPDIRFKVLNNLGIIHYHQGALTRALAYYEEALETAVQMGDVGTAAMTSFNMAKIFYDRGELDRAIAYLGRPLAHYKDNNPIILAQAAMMYHAAGASAKALPMMERAKSIAGDLWGEQSEAILEEIRGAASTQ